MWLNLCHFCSVASVRTRNSLDCHRSQLPAPLDQQFDRFGWAAENLAELLVTYERLAGGRMRARADVDAAVEYGAVERVRPKMMTVTAIIAGLLPILWSQGTGADVMKRIAAPMVGGMVSSTLLTLIVIPAIYSLWRERQLESAVPREDRDLTDTMKHIETAGR